MSFQFDDDGDSGILDLGRYTTRVNLGDSYTDRPFGDDFIFTVEFTRRGISVWLCDWDEATRRLQRPDSFTPAPVRQRTRRGGRRGGAGSASK